MVSADQVASVILARSGTWMTSMQLQKLLYYVQSWHLAVTDEPLFAEHFQAYKDGPVIPQVRHARLDQSTRRPDQDLSGIEIDDLASSLIDLVISSYGSLTGDELSALTHTEIPWVEARGDLPEGAPGNTPIAESSMASFFREHRRLGGRTAADLAAGGVQARHLGSEPVDIDAILASLPSVATEDEWGGANLGNLAVSDGWTPDRRTPVAW